ncbi:MAG: hypothetical protein DHS20C17_23610 [Cyclobacteriaceae bacterium]|nr:MAG: hypothetical protein DHS20C17_23610 [Cyclobacteriaceae bacterium]
MKDKSSNQHEPIKRLTPELMEGYANGTLSPDLMIEVEKFLAENPFEQEAVEGLINQPTHFTNDMMELGEQLADAVKKDKVNTLRYWPVAAAVSLLIISGAVFYLLSPLSSEQSQVAVNQLSTEDHNEHSRDGAISSENEPLAVVPDDPEVEVEHDQEEETARETVSSKVQEDRNLIPQVTPRNEPAGKDKVDPLPAPLKDDVKETDTDRELFSEPSQPNQSFLQESSDEESPPAAGRSQSLNSATPTASSPALRKKAKNFTDNTMASAPSNWAEYLKMHLIYPEPARINGIRGDVKVTFKVKTDGSLYGFQIVESLGYGCDKEAIRILSEGPPWKPAAIGDNPVISRGEITIKFPPDK